MNFAFAGGPSEFISIYGKENFVVRIRKTNDNTDGKTKIRWNLNVVDVGREDGTKDSIRDSNTL